MASYCDITEESAVLDDALLTTITSVTDDAATLDDVLLFGVAAVLVEAAVLNDATSDRITFTTTETALIHGQFTDGGQTVADVTIERAIVGDRVTLTVHNDTAEAAVLNDGSRDAILRTLVESAVLNDALVGTQVLSNVIIESGELGDRIFWSPFNLTTDSAVLDDAIQSFALRTNLTTEVASVHGSVVGGAVVANLTTDEAVLDDAAFSTVLAGNTTTDSGVMDDRLLGGHAGNGWAIPTDTFAMSRYTNFPLRALAELGGVMVGATEDGLVVLAGPNDEGDPIAAEMIGDLVDALDGDGGKARSENLRRPQYLHIGYTTDGVLRFSLSETESGSEVKHDFDLPAKTALSALTNRVKLGKGLRSRYWRYGFANVAGADFNINDGSITFAVLQRRA